MSINTPKNDEGPKSRRTAAVAILIAALAALNATSPCIKEARWLSDQELLDADWARYNEVYRRAGRSDDDVAKYIIERRVSRYFFFNEWGPFLASISLFLGKLPIVIVYELTNEGGELADGGGYLLFGYDRCGCYQMDLLVD